MMPKKKSWLSDEWLRNGVHPKDLGSQAIDADRWDREDLASQLNALPPFSAARQQLQDFAGTGDKAMNDTFWALLKADPVLIDKDKIRPSHLVNRQIAEQMLELDATTQLRRYSVNDDVQAALSATTLEPDLETLFDRTSKQREQAQEFENKLQELAQAIRDFNDLSDKMEGEGEGEGEGGGAGSGEGMSDEERQAAMDAMQAQANDLQELIDALREEAAQAGSELEKSMDKGEAGIRFVLSKAIGEAADEAEQTQATARAWGLEPGELQRKPANERMELAKRLNNDRFRRIADLFGPMHNLMLSEQKRKVVHVNEEVYDVALGNDLARVLPQEILNLHNGLMRLDFLRRYTERQLLTYDLEGTEQLSRGGIVLMEDGSGSMSGERELWAKAVMLCLLHLCRQQKRPMYVVHFGSPGQFKTLSFVRPEDFALENVLDAAELFWASGTDFVTPMKEALRLLKVDYAITGATRADVVMLSDGECAVPDNFMTEYLEEINSMESTTWALDLSGYGRSEGALSKMSENKVAVIADLLSGENVRDMFRAV